MGGEEAVVADLAVVLLGGAAGFEIDDGVERGAEEDAVGAVKVIVGGEDFGFGGDAAAGGEKCLYARVGKHAANVVADFAGLVGRDDAGCDLAGEHLREVGGGGDEREDFVNDVAPEQFVGGGGLVPEQGRFGTYEYAAKPVGR